MGSSKYEFEPDKLDRDIRDRRMFFDELVSEWRLDTGSPEDIYARLNKPEAFLDAAKKHKSKGYTFRFTHECFFEEALKFCAELKRTGAAGASGYATNDLKRDATQTQSGS